MSGADSGGRSKRSNGMPLKRRQASDLEKSLGYQSEDLDATNDYDVFLFSEIASGILPSYSYAQDKIEGPSTKKHIRRLTSQQAHILESFFSICAHPDESQRKQLSATTGLQKHKVRYWFQNKRTQIKLLSDKEENLRLKLEHRIMKEDNERLKEAYEAMFCANCNDSGAQYQRATVVEKLEVENDSLRQELLRLCALAHQSANLSFQPYSSIGNLLERQNGTEMITELAKNAVHELVFLVEYHGPLWQPVPDGSFEILNSVLYGKKFTGEHSANTIGFKLEGTRAEAVVMTDYNNLVDHLMNSERYETFCPGILSCAKTTNTYISEPRYDGAMQSMTIDMVFPSPLVKSRRYTFVRYCTKLREGTMAIVDVSVDDCRKTPSGVVIHSLGANSCKVTMIEHVLVHDAGVHELYQPLGGLMFGARRWVMSMARQCARMRDITHVTRGSNLADAKGRKILMKQADDLLMSYSGSIAGIPEKAWIILRRARTAGDIKVAYSKIEDGKNNAVVSLSASFHLPMPLRRVYDLLRNNMLRPKWDALVDGGAVKEEVRVCIGNGHDDAVTILHVKQADGNKNNIMILQNSYYDVSGSFMVYSPIDNELMNRIMNLSDPKEKMPLYPTGFFLVPGGQAAQSGGGTLMTMGSQILLKLARGTSLHLSKVSSAITAMSEKIATIKETLANSPPCL